MTPEEMTKAMGSPQQAQPDVQTTQGQMTPLQMQKILGLGTSGMTPDQSAGALGASNSLFSKMIGGLSGLGESYGQIGTGIAKGVVQTMEQASAIKAGPVGAEMIRAAPEFAKNVQAAEQFQKPQGTLEQVGYAGEKTAELFAPAGAEKTIFAKGAQYIDKLPEYLGMAGKSASALTGTLKTALQSLISGGSMAGVTQAQTGDTSQTLGAGGLGAFAGGTGRILEEVSPGLLKAIAQSGFKLSPAAEAKTTRIVDRASSFIADNKITGSDSAKYNRLAKLTKEFEATLQASLPEGIAVPKKEIAANIEAGVENLRTTDQAVYNRARTKANEALKLLSEHPTETQFTAGGTMAVKDTLASKRSWAQEAFRGAQQAKKDPEKTNEGAYVIEKAYQTALENTLDRTGTNVIKIPPALQGYFGGKTETTLSEFNKVYSPAISARDLMFTAQYKHDAGLFGRLFGIAVGEIAGEAIAPGPVGKILGMTGGELLTQKIPQAVRGAGEKILAHPEMVPSGAKIFQGITNQPPSNP